MTKFIERNANLYTLRQLHWIKQKFVEALADELDQDLSGLFEHPTRNDPAEDADDSLIESLAVTRRLMNLSEKPKDIQSYATGAFRLVKLDFEKSGQDGRLMPISEFSHKISKFVESIPNWLESELQINEDDAGEAIKTAAHRVANIITQKETQHET